MSASVQRPEAVELTWDVIAAAVAVAVGGTLAAMLSQGIHGNHAQAVMTLSAVVALTGGLYSIYSAVKLLRPASEAARARAERALQRDADMKREGWLQAAAEFGRSQAESPMEGRMSDSLKSIRDEAEQGLFAQDAEQAAGHLRTIWAMAACDLDDPEQPMQ